MKNVSQENSDGETVQKKNKTNGDDGIGEAVRRKKIKSSKKELATTCSNSTPPQRKLRKKEKAGIIFGSVFESDYHLLNFCLVLLQASRFNPQQLCLNKEN